MEPLLCNNVTTNDPVYNYICTDSAERAKVARAYTEALWVKYQPYADHNFKEQIRNDFDARFWEMYLTCTLMDKGYEITKKIGKIAGPDTRVEYEDNIIWIEATTPTSGNRGSSDSVPDLVITNPPTAQQVPDEQIILRYRSAIKEKYDYKYFEYLKNGIVSKEDFYLVAINGCRIPHSGTERELPRIVRSVLPFGHSQVTIDMSSGNIISEGHQYRAQIAKASGCSVRTDIFLDLYYHHINAILFSNINVFNLTSSMGDDFITVHNPLGHQLPTDFLNFTQQWKAQLRGNEVTVFPTD
jgi:type I restriction enzyme S subunit